MKINRKYNLSHTENNSVGMNMCTAIAYELQFWCEKVAIVFDQNMNYPGS